MTSQSAEPKMREFLGRHLSETEYEEICRNLGEYFALLTKWSEESRDS